jgi:ABC-type branched-subunit amino acid transport system ATPase component
MPVLEGRKISAGYGLVPVVHEVDIVVEPGEIVALLGPNGAGKTTTLLALAGDLPLLAGEVYLSDARVTGPLNRRAKRGLSFVTEERSVFMGLTTLQNLRVGGVDHHRCVTLFPELGQRLHVKCGALSGGEQQMLTLARALCRDPQVLLADELSLGLAPLAVARLFGAVRQAVDERGIGVLLVEQHVGRVVDLADRVYVLRRGRVEITGTADEMRPRLREIEESYLGKARADDE